MERLEECQYKKGALSGPSWGRSLEASTNSIHENVKEHDA
jgi:hypothetical protein